MVGFPKLILSTANGGLVMVKAEEKKDPDVDASPTLTPLENVQFKSRKSTWASKSPFTVHRLDSPAPKIASDGSSAELVGNDTSSL